MPLIDNRGRLFGRLNIIDAALVAFVLVLVPVGYTASRLFRVPRPEIASVEPVAQAVGSSWRVRVQGRNFRPYLTAYVSPTGHPFSMLIAQPTPFECKVRLETPTILEVELPAVLEGQYDLYLFDETQEVARRTAAFVVPGGLIEAKVHFSVPARIVPLIKVGDVDVTDLKAPALTLTGTGSGSAMLKAVHMTGERAPAAFELTLMPGRSRWFGSTQNDGNVVDATLTIPVRRNAKGVWEYGDMTVRAGEPFLFQTAQYAIFGVIDEVTAMPPGATASIPEAGK